MVLTRIFLSALAFWMASSATAETAIEIFARYPAKQLHFDKRAQVKTVDRQSRRHRAALADAAERDVDFAGRYVLAEIGCGAGCVRLAALDAPTGRVTWFPATVSNWPRGIVEPVEYRTDSRLVVVHGQLDEKGSAGPRYFIFDGHRFTAHENGSQP